MSEGEFTRRVLAALGENMGILAPAIKQLMAEAWAEGRDAAHEELARMYGSQCEGDCDCSEPRVNPYRATP